MIHASCGFYNSVCIDNGQWFMYKTIKTKLLAETIAVIGGYSLYHGSSIENNSHSFTLNMKNEINWKDLWHHQKYYH